MQYNLRVQYKLWVMNTIPTEFFNGTVTIYQNKSTYSKWVESCGFEVVHEDIPCQICCSEAKTQINDCNPWESTEHDISVRFSPDYVFDAITKDDKNTRISRYEFVVNEDIIGCRGRFKADDLKPIKLPWVWPFAWRLSWFKMV